MRGFTSSNQILLSLFDVLNTFHYSILVCLHSLTHFASMLAKKRV